jgi:hypothetical protein
VVHGMDDNNLGIYGTKFGCFDSLEHMQPEECENLQELQESGACCFKEIKVTCLLWSFAGGVFLKPLFIVKLPIM